MRGSVLTRVAARIYRHESIRRVLRPFFSVPPNARWVFIVGCYNSGTTLLHDVMAQSREVASLPGEGVLFTDQLLTPEHFGWPRLWWKVYEQLAAVGDGGGCDAEIVKRDWAIWYKTRRPYLLEKSISNSVRVHWLNRNFPEARFIYLIRNGYAVSEGIRRRAGRGRVQLMDGLREYPISWCAKQWVFSAKVLDEQLGTIGRSRVLRIRYEDLCASPRAQLRRIGAFLHTNGLDGVDIAKIKDMNNEAIARLSKDDIRAITHVGRKTIQRYGYRVLN